MMQLRAGRQVDDHEDIELAPELGAALDAFGVRAQWNALTAAERAEAVGWVVHEAPTSFQGSRLLAQMLSAGRSVELRSLRRTAHFIESSRTAGPTVATLAQAELDGAPAPDDSFRTIVRLWGAGLVPQTLMRQSRNVGGRAVVDADPDSAFEAVVEEMVFPPTRIQTTRLRRELTSDQALAAAVVKAGFLRGGVLAVTERQVLYIPDRNATWFEWRYPIGEARGTEVHHTRTNLYRTRLQFENDSSLKLSEFNWTDAYRVALRIKHAQAMQSDRAGHLDQLEETLAMARGMRLLSGQQSESAERALSLLRAC